MAKARRIEVAIGLWYNDHDPFVIEARDYGVSGRGVADAMEEKHDDLSVQWVEVMLLEDESAVAKALKEYLDE